MSEPLTGVVRTVRGDLPVEQLGRMDYHEHLFMRSPLLVGDELTDLDASTAETAELIEAGIEAIGELSPIGTGRDPRGVAAIAERTGANIVLATGLHRSAHYHPHHWAHRIAVDPLTELFVRDLTEGCDGNDYQGPLPDATSIRAGLLKVGANYWSIGAFEERVFEAAAVASRRTGAAIVVHLEGGTAGVEVLQLLDRHGVPASRVGLAHVDRNPDPVLHAELIDAGATVGYDGMSRAKYWPDSVLLDCLEATLSRVAAPRVMLGGDVARRSSFRAHGGQPGMRYLPSRFIPRVRERLGDELTDELLVRAPARLFRLQPEEGTAGA